MPEKEKGCRKISSQPVEEAKQNGTKKKKQKTVKKIKTAHTGYNFKAVTNRMGPLQKKITKALDNTRRKEATPKNLRSKSTPT